MTDTAPVRHGRLLADLPAPGRDEHFETLLTRPGCRIERIVSHGHSSPPGDWYDQPGDEWVMLVQGSATLRFADGTTLALQPGDWVDIPAHRRHRVDATGPQTVWLALHFEVQNSAENVGVAVQREG